MEENRGDTCNGIQRPSTLKEMIWGMEEAPWLCTHIIASEKCVKFKVFSSMSSNPLHFLATVLKLSVFHNSKRSPLIDIQPRNWEDLVLMVFTKIVVSVKVYRISYHSNYAYTGDMSFIFGEEQKKRARPSLKGSRLGTNPKLNSHLMEKSKFLRFCWGWTQSLMIALSHLFEEVKG